MCKPFVLRLCWDLKWGLLALLVASGKFRVGYCATYILLRRAVL